MKFRLVTASSLAAVSVLISACSGIPGPAQSAEGSNGNVTVTVPGQPGTDVVGGSSGPGAVPVKPPTKPSSEQFKGDFPGDIAPGYVRWGAGIGGNSDPVSRHESVAGKAMGLRRTFWRWDQRTTSMITTSRADLAAGRIPWVSVKTPGWAAMASGSLDGEIDQMIRALDGLNGPVWLTVHHEPEGGGGAVGPDDPGGAAAWRAMQKRVRQRIDAVGTDNIAFAPILMSWTFDSRSNRNPADWWVDGIWDFAGTDHYVDLEKFTSFELPSWTNMRAFYTAKGLKIAVGEWGNRGTDVVAANEVQSFYDTAIASGRSGQAQVIGLAAFDSNLNSPKGGWELLGNQLTKFRQLMLKPTSLLADQSGS